MKAKLLKKLRKIGRDMVEIRSITTDGETTIGMRYAFEHDEYRGIYSIGDTEEDVMQKACKIYLRTNIDDIRKRYRKYSRSAR